MNTNDHSIIRFGLVSALALTAGYSATAQDSGTQEEPAAEETRRFTTVKVTAQRREQNLVDVPLSVSAFDGDLLADLGVSDLTEVAKISPNVNLEVSRATNTTLTAFIRGVGQQDPVPGFESGVGIYVDDVYLNRPQAAVLDVYDVERIEVLRGPQGTLYGRNTIGGAIKYVTRGLSDVPTYDVSLKAGSYNQFDGIVTTSLPVTDTFRVGAAVASLNRDGFGENIITGDDNYDKNLFGARLSAELDVTDTFQLRAAADYSLDKSSPRQGHRLIPDQLPPFDYPVLGDVFDTRAGLDAIKQEVEAYGTSLIAEVDVSDNWKIKNILAYREDESSTPIDFDSLPVADIDVPGIYKNDQFSEELQLLYSGERLNGLVGLYYLDANSSVIFDVLLATTGDLISIPGLNAQTFGDVNTNTWSIFGDFTYDLTNQLSVSLGGRYTEDTRHSIVQRRTFAGGFSPTFGGNGVVIATTSDFDGEQTFDDFSPRVSVSYQPTPDTNLYAIYSQGFKGGSFDPRGQTSAAPDLDQDGTVSPQEIFEFMQFDPETVNSYEVGYKASQLDGRVNYSLAAFYSDYQDVQVPGSIGFDSDGDGVNDNFTGATTNAGQATMWGVEFEGNATVAEDLARSGDLLNLGWAVGYLDAQYDEFITAVTTNGVTALEDVSDQRVIQNTPDWTANGRIAYDTPFVGGNLLLNTQVTYRGDSSQFEIPGPLDQEAFTLWDASARWETADGRWGFNLTGKNLTDEEYIVAGYDFVTGTTLGVEGTLTAFYGNPRTVTLGVDYSF